MKENLVKIKRTINLTRLYAVTILINYCMLQPVMIYNYIKYTIQGRQDEFLRMLEIVRLTRPKRQGMIEGYKQLWRESNEAYYKARKDDT